MPFKFFDMKKNFNFIGVICCLVTTGYTQDPQHQQVIREMQLLAANYQAAGTVSFDVRYRYADEHTPATILDSLSGSYQVAGSRYWYTLDNTEAVADSEYVLMVFREDKLLYLSRPSRVANSINPVSLLDSTLVRIKDLVSRISEQGGQKIISLEFPAGQQYKKIEYTVDKQSGFISHMQLVVRNNQLFDTSLQAQASSLPGYAIISLDFTHYQIGRSGENKFDLSRYLKKDGNVYVPAAPYGDYRIFLASPNLQ